MSYMTPPTACIQHSSIISCGRHLSAVLQVLHCQQLLLLDSLVVHADLFIPQPLRIANDQAPVQPVGCIEQGPMHSGQGLGTHSRAGSPDCWVCFRIVCHLSRADSWLTLQSRVSSVVVTAQSSSATSAPAAHQIKVSVVRWRAHRIETQGLACATDNNR
jgi:hypothetical protein